MKRTHKRRPENRPLSRTDKLTAATAQEWAHSNSAVIASRVRVLLFEREEVDKAIVMLSATLANARERRATLDAVLAGLQQVVGRR